MMLRNIVVGISGGVDSAVSAFLLKERGFRVLGVFMKNWDEVDESGRCTGEQELADAEYTCRRLDIELRQVNFVKEYWNHVFSSFIEDYKSGLTPNPDILCDKHIKYDIFEKYALEHMGCDAIATGHYANTNYGKFLEHYEPDKGVRLLIPKDQRKDQTYFLSQVQRQALRRAMFPIGDMLKSDVKALARKLGLERLAVKRESMGICFIGKRNFRQFIGEYVTAKPGDVIDIDTGEVLDRHEGLHFWTVGQRYPLTKGKSVRKMIARKDPATNALYIAMGREHPALYRQSVNVGEINWLCEPPVFDDTFSCRVRYRNTQPLRNCKLQRATENGAHFLLEFEQPAFGVAPGQFAAFYDETSCLGSARILQDTAYSAAAFSSPKENIAAAAS